MKNTEIVSLFNKYKKSPEMQTPYYMDGCIQRTGKILFDLEEQSQEVSFLLCLGSKEKIKSKEHANISWHQHYVPVVFDENGDAVVLDICLLNGPEYVDEYKKHFENLQILADQDADLCLNDLDGFEIENYAQKLQEIAENKKNQENKIIPNTVKSKWMQKYNEEFALRRRLTSQLQHHS